MKEGRLLLGNVTVTALVGAIVFSSCGVGTAVTDRRETNQTSSIEQQVAEIVSRYEGMQVTRSSATSPLLSYSTTRFDSLKQSIEDSIGALPDISLADPDSCTQSFSEIFQGTDRITKQGIDKSCLPGPQGEKTNYDHRMTIASSPEGTPFRWRLRSTDHEYASELSETPFADQLTGSEFSLHNLTQTDRATNLLVQTSSDSYEQIQHELDYQSNASQILLYDSSVARNIEAKFLRSDTENAFEVYESIEVIEELNKRHGNYKFSYTHKFPTYVAPIPFGEVAENNESRFHLEQLGTHSSLTVYQNCHIVSVAVNLSDSSPEFAFEKLTSDCHLFETTTDLTIDTTRYDRTWNSVIELAIAIVAKKSESKLEMNLGYSGLDLEITRKLESLKLATVPPSACDPNQDGIFNSSDLVAIFSQTETKRAELFDCNEDGIWNESDFVAMFQKFPFQRN